eukprot:tig00000949_g5722.t1
MARLGAALNLLDPVRNRKASVVPEDVKIKLQSGPLKEVLSKESKTELSDVMINSSDALAKVIATRSDEEVKAAEAQYHAAMNSFTDDLDRLQDGKLFAQMKYEIEFYRRLRIDRMLWFWLTQIRARRNKPKSVRALRRWQSWIAVCMDPRFHKYTNPFYYQKQMAKRELGLDPHGDRRGPAWRGSFGPAAAPAPANSAPAPGGATTARGRSGARWDESCRLEGWRPAFFVAPGERLPHSALDEMTMGPSRPAAGAPRATPSLRPRRPDGPARRERGHAMRYKMVGPEPTHAVAVRRAPPGTLPGPGPARSALSAPERRGLSWESLPDSAPAGLGPVSASVSPGIDGAEGPADPLGSPHAAPLPGFLRPTASYVVKHPVVLPKYSEFEIGGIAHELQRLERMALAPAPAKEALPERTIVGRELRGMYGKLREKRAECVAWATRSHVGPIHCHGAPEAHQEPHALLLPPASPNSPSPSRRGSRASSTRRNSAGEADHGACLGGGGFLARKASAQYLAAPGYTRSLSVSLLGPERLQGMRRPSTSGEVPGPRHGQPHPAPVHAGPPDGHLPLAGAGAPRGAGSSHEDSGSSRGSQHAHGEPFRAPPIAHSPRS